MPESIILQELRLVKFRDYDDRRCSGRLTQSEAASLLGMSERPFRCYSRRYEAEGAEGLFDRRLGRVPQNRVCVDRVVKMLRLFDARDLNICARSTTGI